MADTAIVRCDPLLFVCHGGTIADAAPCSHSSSEECGPVEPRIVPLFLLWYHKAGSCFDFVVDNRLIPGDGLWQTLLYGQRRVWALVHAVCVFQSGRITGHGLSGIEQETVGFPPLVPPFDGPVVVLAWLPLPAIHEYLRHGYELFRPYDHVRLLFLTFGGMVAAWSLPASDHDRTDPANGSGLLFECGGHLLQSHRPTVPGPLVQHDFGGGHLFYLFLLVCTVLLQALPPVQDGVAVVMRKLNWVGSIGTCI